MARNRGKVGAATTMIGGKPDTTQPAEDSPQYASLSARMRECEHRAAIEALSAMRRARPMKPPRRAAQETED